MDTKLHIVATLDTSPGMEGAVHIEGEGIERIHYVNKKTAAELVKRWNAYPELVEAIKDLDLRATQARIASSIGQPRLKDADFLRGEMERISQVAHTLLQTLKA